MQDRWWEQKSEEVQLYADTNKSKKLYSAIKAICGLPEGTPRPSPTSADGSTIIKDKQGIRGIWEGRFDQLLNRAFTVDRALQQMPQKPLLKDFDLLPSADEVKTDIKEMNSGKTLEADGIPAELYKAIGTTAFKAFHDILVSIWEVECTQADFRDVTIVALYKTKGAKSDCGNYRSISLLSISGKKF